MKIILLILALGAALVVLGYAIPITLQVLVHSTPADSAQAGSGAASVVSRVYLNPHHIVLQLGIVTLAVGAVLLLAGVLPGRRMPGA